MPANAGDTEDVGSILGSGRSPGEGNGNSLKYYCLEYYCPMDRGAWQATVSGVAFLYQIWYSYAMTHNLNRHL